jgi:hypothetical protein
MSLLEALLLFACAALMCWNISLSLSQRKMRRVFSKLERRLSISGAGAVGMGERITDLQSKIADLKALPREDSDDQELDAAYRKAKALIEQGLSEQIIAASSGLSESEIQLMRLVHAKDRIQRSSKIVGAA